MSVSEHERYELYLAIEGLIGSERAATMMSMLPPVGWADIATKRDLDDLEHRIEANLERTLREQTRTMVFALLGAQATLASLMVASLAIFR